MSASPSDAASGSGVPERGFPGGDAGRPSLIVTIDGPAGSGKSTTAKEVSRRLGFRHLDSGALYRALTLALLRKGIPEEAWDALDPEAFAALDVRIDPDAESFAVLLGGQAVGEELRSPGVTGRVPHLARLGPARERLLELQRSAPRFGGIVADGRDMGTVIFPEAPHKFFLTASLEERARRRLLQEGRVPDPDLLAAEVARIRERDGQDSGRELAPLRRPGGSILIDTTALDFGEQVRRIVEGVRGAPGGGPDASAFG